MKVDRFSRMTLAFLSEDGSVQLVFGIGDLDSLRRHIPPKMVDFDEEIDIVSVVGPTRHRFLNSVYRMMGTVDGRLRINVYDRFGAHLSASELAELFPRDDDPTKPRPHSSRWRIYGPYTFRKGPVPGISKGSGYCYFRHPHTFPERREAIFADEGEPGPRGRRSFANLPTPNDDIHRSMTRSWKKHRRTQWK